MLFKMLVIIVVFIIIISAQSPWPLVSGKVEYSYTSIWSQDEVQIAKLQSPGMILQISAMNSCFILDQMYSGVNVHRYRETKIKNCFSCLTNMEIIFYQVDPFGI